MRNIKRILGRAIVFLSLLCLCGCGKAKGTYNLKELSEEEKSKLNLEEIGTERQRSIDDISVHQNPLVYKENVYFNGELEEIIEYEYDDKGRYTTVSYFDRESDSEEIELCKVDYYSYDDYFSYKESCSIHNNGTTLQQIHDAYGNAVLLQYLGENGEIHNITYTYQHSLDTDRIYEEYCYRGEENLLDSHVIRRFNEYGDEEYLMKQYGSVIQTENKEYNYDEEGQIKSVSTIEETTYLGGNSTEEELILYTYNEEGLLISENEKKIIDIEVTKTVNTTYEYDNQNRLARKRIITDDKTYDGDAYYGETEMIVEYEYYI